MIRNIIKELIFWALGYVPEKRNTWKYIIINGDNISTFIDTGPYRKRELLLPDVPNASFVDERTTPHITQLVVAELWFEDYHQKLAVYNVVKSDATMKGDV